MLRGRFGPGASEDEWCERHLLARIHRYTVKRLRRDIEPVELADCMRFRRLAASVGGHPHAGARGAGHTGRAAGRLPGGRDGLGSDLLPARLKDYGSTWLDELCRSGRIVWTRLSGRLKASGGPVRGTPIVLLPRRQLGAWHALASDAPAPELSSRAQRVFDYLQTHGALFFDELQHDAHLLRSEAGGRPGRTGGGRAGERRQLRRPACAADAGQQAFAHGAANPRSAFIGGMADAGRWALVRKPAEAEETTGRSGFSAEALEHIARVLLRRYGVVFWRLLAREADWLPPWRELLRVYHRLEARGEIRGGRFVAGVAGEQFALPEALALLREVRKRPLAGELLAVSAVDPLNQLGTLLPGSRCRRCRATASSTAMACRWRRWWRASRSGCSTSTSRRSVRPCAG